MGFRIPWAEFPIPEPGISDSTRKIFPRFRIPQAKIFRIPESLTWGKHESGKQNMRVQKRTDSYGEGLKWDGWTGPKRSNCCLESGILKRKKLKREMFSLKSLFLGFINFTSVVKFDKFTVKPSSITLAICLITLNVQGVRPVSANEQKMVEEQGKKREWKTAGKEKKRAYRHLFELTSVRPLPADFQKCQNVRCRRVFKRLPCLFDHKKVIDF